METLKRIMAKFYQYGQEHVLVNDELKLVENAIEDECELMLLLN